MHTNINTKFKNIWQSIIIWQSTIKALFGKALSSLWRRANTWNVSFRSLYGGQFTLSTQLIKPNYLVILPSTQHHSFFRNLPPLSYSVSGQNILLSQKIFVTSAGDRHISPYLKRNQRDIYYSTIIKPVMLYGSTIWTSCSKEDFLKVLRLQKTCA